MAIEIRYRFPEAPPGAVDRLVKFLETGQGQTLTDFSAGPPRAYAIYSTEENNGAAYVHIVDPSTVLIRQIGEERMFDPAPLTEANRIAMLAPGEICGLPLVAQPGYYAGHLIIENINFDALLEGR